MEEGLMILKNKRIVVLGGAGFIGSHLVDRLLQDEPERIEVVDNLTLGKRSNIPGDRQVVLRERDAECYLVEGGIEADICFNLAVDPLPKSLTHPTFVWDNNVNIVMALVEAMRGDTFRHVVHVSSSEVYGTQVSDTPMNEDHPQIPLTPYAASKAACDQLILSYVHTYGINAMIVRPFNTYGPRQNAGSYAGVIPATVARLLRGEKPVIYGTGHQTRDFTYVTDICEGILAAAGWKHGVINLCSGKETSMNELIYWLTTIYKYGAMYYATPVLIESETRHELERPADVDRHIGDNTRARELLGWSPQVTMPEGLKRTVGWYVNKGIDSSRRAEERTMPKDTTTN